MDFGYTLMCEQSDARSLVRNAGTAEASAQIGGDVQHPFLEWSQDELLAALRSAGHGA